MILEIKIWADINSTGLFDALGRQISRKETTINKDTWERLQKWVERYEDVALMEIEERSANSRLVSELDSEGLTLLSEIQKEWPTDKNFNPIKFRYYSEGFLKYLDKER